MAWIWRIVFPYLSLRELLSLSLLDKTFQARIKLYLQGRVKQLPWRISVDYGLTSYQCYIKLGWFNWEDEEISPLTIDTDEPIQSTVLSGVGGNYAQQLTEYFFKARSCYLTLDANMVPTGVNQIGNGCLVTIELGHGRPTTRDQCDRARKFLVYSEPAPSESKVFVPYTNKRTYTGSHYQNVTKEAKRYLKRKRQELF